RLLRLTGEPGGPDPEGPDVRAARLEHAADGVGGEAGRVAGRGQQLDRVLRAVGRARDRAAVCRRALLVDRVGGGRAGAFGPVAGVVVEVVVVVRDPRLGRGVGALLVEVPADERDVVVRGLQGGGDEQGHCRHHADDRDHRVAGLLAPKSLQDQTHGRLSWFGYWPAFSSRRSTESFSVSGDFVSRLEVPCGEPTTRETSTIAACGGVAWLGGRAVGDAHKATVTSW